jgi:nitroreductase
MNVSNAIQSRQSVRAFTQQPVDPAVLREILELAGRAPSGGNLQPWKVHAVTGSAREALIQAVYATAATQPAGEAADIRMYPEGLQEPWRGRRADCGERMYNALGIARDDKPARFAQGAKNLSFFNAPVGLVVTMDRSLAESQMMDVGMFIMSILLLAQERGLATCPQASWQMWAPTIRDALGLDESEMVMAGISLGYADPGDAGADIRQPRAALDDYASFHGFEEH